MYSREPFTLRLTMIFFLIIALSSGVLACKKKEEAPAPASAPLKEEAAPAVPAAAPEGPAARETEPARQADTRRKVILNHSISIEVKDFPVALEALTRLAEASGGYVFNSSRSSREKGSSVGQVGIRVPAGKSSGVLRSIRGLGRVENENSTAEDITEGYVDMEARLKNARSSEARLLELYHRAGKLEDILSVEEELTRVRGDIEAFEAKKKNWDILTQMVTIEISLHEPSSGFPTLHRFCNPISTAFGEALEMFADSLHALIIFLGAIIPWLALLSPFAYLYLVRRRRRKQEKVREENKDQVQGK